MTTILASCSPGEIRAAAVDGQKLLDFSIWRPGAPDQVGAVFQGRVTAHLPALAGAFVALPDGLDGFLPDSEGGAELHDGDTVVVRVSRAAQGGKGPRLTCRNLPVLSHAGGGPALLRPGPDAIERLLALYPSSEVQADHPRIAARFNAALVKQAFPEWLESEIDQLSCSDIETSTGLRLHIAPTPALTAIDVDLAANSAARGGKQQIHLNANRAVIPELARQIRLRNLSGAILIDLAGLHSKARAALRADFDIALRDDPLHPRLLGFTALGFAEIARPRATPPLHELLSGPHSAALVALRYIARAKTADPSLRPVLRAHPGAVAALQSDQGAMTDIADILGMPLPCRSDLSLSLADWRMEANTA